MVKNKYRLYPRRSSKSMTTLALAIQELAHQQGITISFKEALELLLTEVIIE